MGECDCQVPTEHTRPGRCAVCGGEISAEWSSNAETVEEFYDRLEESMFALGIINAGQTPEWWQAFRTQAEVRELAGRKTFGHSFHGRDNPREATEEAADLGNYAMFSILASRRLGDPEEWELALTVAKHAALAHHYASALRSHRHEPISSPPGPR